MSKKVILPKRKIHKTPRLLQGDAYTIGSDKFESEEAREKSTYYLTFRRKLHAINATIYDEGDDRIVFTSLPNILEKLFYEPITHAEIDEAKRFLAHAKVSGNGFTEYQFPEEIWRRVVDEFNGRPPISIRAVREGSVIYPNEPAIEVISAVKGMGVLGAWFESKLLHVWATTQRATQGEHVIVKLKQKIKLVDPDMSEADLDMYASIMLTDFGDRAGVTSEESEILGMVHLYSFNGTDTFSGAYQAWKNSNEEIGIFSSVNALAHRNVQSYKSENDCYQAIYNSIGDNEICSLVNDCYDAKNSTKTMILPLALRSKNEGNGKIVVARPDSSTPEYTMKHQVLEICNLAHENGLSDIMETSTGTWKTGTYLKFLDGDGEKFEGMFDIIDELIANRYAFYTWGLFGMGGTLRNNKRDDLSAKFALSAVGADDRGVVKFSETIGKGTLPGPFKLLRDPKSIKECKTIVFAHEDGDDNLVPYFDGNNIWEPFGVGQSDTFLEIKNRIKEQMRTMPLTLETPENHNFPCSDAVMDLKKALLIEYAPNKII